MERVSFQTASFTTGSYIQVADQPGVDYFYIIRQGMISEITKEFANTPLEETKLGPGDFCGVVSCMSGRTTLSDVMAVTDVLLVRIGEGEFGALLKQVPSVAIKLLHHFSLRLKLMNNLLQKTMSQAQTQRTAGDRAQRFYDLAQFYTAQKRHMLASRAYASYLHENPYGEHVEQAQAYLQGPDAVKVEITKGEQFLSRYQVDEPVFLQGEMGDHLYIIKSGEVSVVTVVENKELLLAILKPGDIFGEMAIMNDDVRGATVVCSADCELMAVSRSNFDSVVKSQTAIAEKIIRHLSERIWVVSRQISNQLIQNYTLRLYHALLTQLHMDRVPIQAEQRHVFRLSLEDIVRFAALPEKEGIECMQNIIDTDPMLYLQNGALHCRDVTGIQQAHVVLRRSMKPSL